MPEPTIKAGDLGDAPIIPIALILSGGYLAWFGVHYWRRDIRWPSDPVKSVLRGKGLPAQGSITTSAAILTSIESQTPTGDSGASNSSIAGVAASYGKRGESGHCYIFGGSPGHDGTHCWDCSSMVNFVLGIRLGLAIPGYAPGQYDGSIHGPTTLSYLAWSGATTVGHTSSQAEPGDLCVWQTHMGIALGNGEMVSALNESLGTRITSIDGIVNGELLQVRRVNGTGKTGGTPEPKPPSSPPPAQPSNGWYKISKPFSSATKVEQLTESEASSLKNQGYEVFGPYATKDEAESA